MGLIIQDKLNEIEILMPKVDVVFIPDIHPDGLLLHYSTTYKYNSELEDFFLSNNSFIVSTKITTYLRKEYGVIDLNDTMYGDNFKEWPLFVTDIIKKLSTKNIKRIEVDIERGIQLVLNYLIEQNEYNVENILYPQYDKKVGVQFSELYIRASNE